MTKVYTLKCDGACKNNPGIGSSASVIYENGAIIDQAAQYFTHTTNNVAEYKSLLLGIKRALKLGIKDLKIQMDSQLVVKQVRMEYKINNPVLKGLHVEIMEQLSKLDSFTIDHIYRTENKDADALANLCVQLKEDIK